MNYKESLEYVMNIPRFAKENTLERVREILSALNNPEQGLKFIHIAGTNGKGSTTTMLSSILKSSGRKVGTFISPFVYDFLERIQINCAPVNEEIFASAISRVREICESKNLQVNFFEIMTATALLIFAEQKCDIVVLEVGLGGRFDATNVIPSPLLAVITTLALDHTEFLGDTIDKIAFEKCGIIKKGSSVVTGENNDDAAKAVIEKTCRDLSVSLTYAAQNFTVLSESIEKTEVLYNGEKLSLPLVGKHQLLNLALVLTCSEKLELPLSAIKDGLAKVKFPARLEIKSKNPLIIVDGAHNENGMLSLKSSIENLLPDKKIITIFGCMKDKSSESMVKIAESFSDVLILTKPNTPRSEEPSNLLKHCNGLLSENLKDALKIAKENIPDRDALIVCGSLYLASETKTLGQ